MFYTARLTRKQRTYNYLLQLKKWKEKRDFIIIPVHSHPQTLCWLVWVYGLNPPLHYGFTSFRIGFIWNCAEKSFTTSCQLFTKNLFRGQILKHPLTLWWIRNSRSTTGVLNSSSRNTFLPLYLAYGSLFCKHMRQDFEKTHLRCFVWNDA